MRQVRRAYQSASWVEHLQVSVKEQVEDQDLEARLRRKADIRPHGQSGSYHEASMIVVLPLPDGCTSSFGDQESCGGYDQKIVALAAVAADSRTAAAHHRYFFDHRFPLVLAARTAEVTHIVAHVAVHTYCCVEECEGQ